MEASAMEGKKRLTRAERLKKKHGLTNLAAELGAVEPQYQAKLYQRLERERQAEEQLKSGKKRRSSWPFLPGGFESNSR